MTGRPPTAEHPAPPKELEHGLDGGLVLVQQPRVVAAGQSDELVSRRPARDARLRTRPGEPVLLVLDDQQRSAISAARRAGRGVRGRPCRAPSAPLALSRAEAEALIDVGGRGVRETVKSPAACSTGGA